MDKETWDRGSAISRSNQGCLQPFSHELYNYSKEGRKDGAEEKWLILEQSKDGKPGALLINTWILHSQRGRIASKTGLNGQAYQLGFILLWPTGVFPDPHQNLSNMARTAGQSPRHLSSNSTTFSSVPIFPGWGPD